jgi:hypothetical protein
VCPVRKFEIIYSKKIKKIFDFDEGVWFAVDSASCGSRLRASGDGRGVGGEEQLALKE